RARHLAAIFSPARCLETARAAPGLALFAAASHPQVADVSTPFGHVGHAAHRSSPRETKSVPKKGVPRQDTGGAHWPHHSRSDSRFNQAAPTTPATKSRESERRRHGAALRLRAYPFLRSESAVSTPAPSPRRRLRSHRWPRARLPWLLTYKDIFICLCRRSGRKALTPCPSTDPCLSKCASTCSRPWPSRPGCACWRCWRTASSTSRTSPASLARANPVSAAT